MLKKNLTDFVFLVKRDMKVFYLDKASFFSSLISPFMLVILYITFLKNVYDDSLMSVLKQFSVTVIPASIMNGFSAGWLLSSIMATTCITLTFCGNTIVVSDRINGSIEDIKAAPVSRVNIFLAYFAANFLSTFLVALIALGIGFIYIAIVGWYLSFVDVLMLIVCSAFLTLFGSLFASIVMSFVKSQGVLTTCSIVVSALYGFICGAYMPISSFGKGLANVIYCLPGTYGTMTLRHYFCHGVLDKLEENLVGQIGSEKASMATQSIAKGFDIKIEAFGNTISVSNAMLILIFSALGMLLLYSLIVFLENKKKAPKTGALKRD